MKACVMVLAFLAVNLSLLAQGKVTFTVKAGESIADVLTPEDIFKYPDFIKGKVLYTSGSYTETLLNYNKVLGEMQFINSRGDTVIIANPEDISFISLPEDTFYISEGYLEAITGNDNVMLVVKNYVKLMDVRKQGAYGMSSTGNIDNYTSVSSGTNTGTVQLKSNQDMIYSYEVEYYFTSDKVDYVPARKNSILKLYPDHKDEIRSFIKEHSINFNRLQDLISLTEFVANLVK